MERMDEDSLPRMEYVHQKMGKRRRGRLCLIDIEKAEMEDGDWRIVAQNKEHLRKVVHKMTES